MLQNEQLSKQLVQVELQSLKSQLNPHFLFNTLNTISSLIRLDNKTKAVKALSELSLMLRKVLENRDNQFITLNEELAFINSYLTIQKMRFEDKLSTDIDIENNCLAAKIPFMLLQPLVENAVKYAIEPRKQDGFITIAAEQLNGRLVIDVLDNGNGKNDEVSKGLGIGISNTKARLDAMFNGDYEINITSNSHNGTTVSISIPLRQ